MTKELFDLDPNMLTWVADRYVLKKIKIKLHDERGREKVRPVPSELYRFVQRATSSK